MKIFYKHRSKIYLSLILLIGLYLRLTNLSSWFHFEFDEEVIAWKLKPFLTIRKPFLIGGGTPFGFHLGPAFYYLSAIPLFFSRLDPIGWGIAAAIFGTATILLMWLVGKSLFNSRVGLIAALLWAASFTAVMTDRHWWPLVLDPMLSLIVILCLFRILKGVKFRKLNNKWWVTLGLALSFAWQADLTVLPLFLAAAVMAVLNFRRQRKGILAAVGILAVSFLPLVFFELRHPGQNLSRLFSYEFLKRADLAVARSALLIKQLAETMLFISAGLSRLLFPVANSDGNLLKFYSWCREMADGRVAGQPWWAGGLTVILLIVPFISEKFAKRHDLTEVSQTSSLVADKILRILILSGVVGIVMFRLRGGNLYDFYLAVLYPVVLLLTARAVDFVWREWGKIVAIVGLTVMVGLNLATIANAYHPQGLALKRQAVDWVISNVGKEEFDLESISNCSRYNGVRFLFWLVGKEPQQSFVDPELAWLYDKKGDYMKPKFLVTFTTPNDTTPDQNEKYNQLKQKAVNSGIFSSDLEVIISPYD